MSKLENQALYERQAHAAMLKKLNHQTDDLHRQNVTIKLYQNVLKFEFPDTYKSKIENINAHVRTIMAQRAEGISASVPEVDGDWV